MTVEEVVTTTTIDKIIEKPKEETLMASAAASVVNTTKVAVVRDKGQILKSKLDFIDKQELEKIIISNESDTETTSICVFLTSDPCIINAREELLVRYGAEPGKGGIVAFVPAYTNRDETKEVSQFYFTLSDRSLAVLNEGSASRYPQTYILHRLGDLYAIVCVVKLPSLKELSNGTNASQAAWLKTSENDKTCSFVREVLFAEACSKSEQLEKDLRESNKYLLQQMLNSTYTKIYCRYLSDNNITFMPTDACVTFNVGMNGLSDWSNFQKKMTLEGAFKHLSTDKEFIENILSPVVNPDDSLSLKPMDSVRFSVNLGDASNNENILHFKSINQDIANEIQMFLVGNGLTFKFPAYIGEFLLSVVGYNNFLKRFYYTTTERKKILELKDSEDIMPEQLKEIDRITSIDKLEQFYNYSEFQNEIKAQVSLYKRGKHSFLSNDAFEKRKLSILYSNSGLANILTNYPDGAVRYSALHGLHSCLDHIYTHELQGEATNTKLLDIFSEGVLDLFKNQSNKKEDKGSIEVATMDFLFCKSEYRQAQIKNLAGSVGVNPDALCKLFINSGSEEGFDLEKDLFINEIRSGFLPLILGSEDNCFTNETICLPALYNPYIGALIIMPSVYDNFIKSFSALTVGRAVPEVLQSHKFGTAVSGDLLLSMLKEYDDLLKDGKSVELLKSLSSSEYCRAFSFLMALIFRGVESMDNCFRELAIKQETMMSLISEKYKDIDLNIDPADIVFKDDDEDAIGQAEGDARIIELNYDKLRSIKNDLKKQLPLSKEGNKQPSDAVVVPRADSTIKVVSLSKNAKVLKNGIVIEDTDIKETTDDDGVVAITQEIVGKIEKSLLLSNLSKSLNLRYLFLQKFASVIQKQMILKDRNTIIKQLELIEKDLDFISTTQSSGYKGGDANANKMNAIDACVANAKALIMNKAKGIAEKLEVLKNFKQVRNVLLFEKYNKMVVELQPRTVVFDTRSGVYHNLGPISIVFPFNIKNESVFRGSNAENIKWIGTPKNEKEYIRFLSGNRDDARTHETAYGPRYVIHGADLGKVCLGDSKAGFNRAFAAGNVPMLVSLAIQYAESYNKDDPWGKRIGFWDACGKDDTLVDTLRSTVFKQLEGCCTSLQLYPLQGTGCGTNIQCMGDLTLETSAYGILHYLRDNGISLKSKEFAEALEIINHDRTVNSIFNVIHLQVADSYVQHVPCWLMGARDMRSLDNLATRTHCSGFSSSTGRRLTNSDVYMLRFSRKAIFDSNFLSALKAGVPRSKENKKFDDGLSFFGFNEPIVHALGTTVPEEIREKHYRFMLTKNTWNFGSVNPEDTKYGLSLCTGYEILNIATWMGNGQPSHVGALMTPLTQDVSGEVYDNIERYEYFGRWDTVTSIHRGSSAPVYIMNVMPGYDAALVTTYSDGIFDCVVLFVENNLDINKLQTESTAETNVKLVAAIKENIETLKVTMPFIEKWDNVISVLEK